MPGKRDCDISYSDVNEPGIEQQHCSASKRRTMALLILSEKWMTSIHASRSLGKIDRLWNGRWQWCEKAWFYIKSVLLEYVHWKPEYCKTLYYNDRWPGRHGAQRKSISNDHVFWVDFFLFPSYPISKYT